MYYSIFGIVYGPFAVLLWILVQHEPTVRKAFFIQSLEPFQAEMGFRVSKFDKYPLWVGGSWNTLGLAGHEKGIRCNIVTLQK